MIHELKRSQLPWKIRVGIDIGPVVAGIVGEARYQYDICGSTVNLAARMASYAEANSLALAADAFQAIWHRYTPHLISSVYMKNKGRIKVVQIQPDR
jgi:class 3 adenylate cyclase